MQGKVALDTSDSGKRKSKMDKHITHGYYLVEGKMSHPMEDYVVAKFKQVGENEVGLFAVFDGHLSHVIPEYLGSHLFENILNEVTYLNTFSSTPSLVSLHLNIFLTTILFPASSPTSGKNQRLQSGKVTV